jgi:hypothetical protein
MNGNLIILPKTIISYQYTNLSIIKLNQRQFYFNSVGCDTLIMEVEKSGELIEDVAFYKRRRVLVVILLFLGYTFGGIYRTNLSVTIVGMKLIICIALYT